MIDTQSPPSVLDPEESNGALSETVAPETVVFAALDGSATFITFPDDEIPVVVNGRAVTKLRAAKAIHFQGGIYVARGDEIDRLRNAPQCLGKSDAPLYRELPSVDDAVRHVRDVSAAADPVSEVERLQAELAAVKAELAAVQTKPVDGDAPNESGDEFGESVFAGVTTATEAAQVLGTRGVSLDLLKSPENGQISKAKIHEVAASIGVSFPDLKA